MPYLVINKNYGAVIASFPTRDGADRLAKLTNARNKGTAQVVDDSPSARPTRRKTAKKKTAKKAAKRTGKKTTRRK